MSIIDGDGDDVDSNVQVRAAFDQEHGTDVDQLSEMLKKMEEEAPSLPSEMKVLERQRDELSRQAEKVSGEISVIQGAIAGLENEKSVRFICVVNVIISN